MGQLFNHHGRLGRRQRITRRTGHSAMFRHIGKDQDRAPSALTLCR
jgi:hypothetical protein